MAEQTLFCFFLLSEFKLTLENSSLLLLCCPHGCYCGKRTYFIGTYCKVNPIVKLNVGNQQTLHKFETWLLITCTLG